MAEQTPVQVSSVVGQGPDVLSCAVDDDMVLMRVESGRYYYLNQTGRAIWTLLESPLPVSELCAMLVDRFEINANQCEREILAFVEDMRRDGLVVLMS